MNDRTFASWLRSEVFSAKCALLTLHERMEKLQYIDGPRLEQEYMDKIGSFEQEVIKAEIEYELLQKKQQMIQAALNRREPINEAAIDAAIDEMRQQLLNDASGVAAPQEYALLSDEQSEELQQLYRGIVKDFHPQMHPELTAVQKQLFHKAQEAYRRRDLPTLKLIHEMLVSTIDDGGLLELLLNLLPATESDSTEEVKKERPQISVDYELTALIYPNFKPTATEASIQEEWMTYQKNIETKMSEMDELRQTFPYNTADMLSDTGKVNAYMEELRQRLRQAEASSDRLRQTISSMLEGVTVRE